MDSFFFGQTWLIGYEFPATGLLITKDKTVIVTSSAKAKHLEQIKSRDVEILSRSKDADHNKKLFEQFIVVMKEAGKNVGVFAKDKFEGSFINEWNVVFGEVEKDFNQIDVSADLANAIEIKDEEELRTIRTASKASMGLMTQYFADEMSTIIDEERKITHSTFSEKIDKKIEDEKFFRGLKLGSEFDPMHLDWCYTPIIQSGGKYDLKPSALSDDSRLSAGVILSSLGLRYKSYCSNISRTYLIDPTSQQRQNYMVLLNLQKKLLEFIKDGVKCSEVYNKAIELIKSSKNPSLEQCFLKNCGWGIGIDFRDASSLLNNKNNHILKDGMTLNLVLGFQNIPNEENAKKTYSLLLSDTIRVTDDQPIVFTDSPKGLNDISFEFKEPDDQKPIKNEKPKERESTLKSSAILKSRLRGDGRSHDEQENLERKRILHQQDLHERLQKTGSERFADDQSGTNGTNKVVFKKFESYKRGDNLPSQAKELKIMVDPKAQSIIIPINGHAVPFHISAYKNGSKNEEGDYVYLRLNFNSPGQAGGVKKVVEGEIPFEDPSAHFLRSITLRSRDTERMNEIFKKISDLKKEAVKKEAQQKELQDVIVQDKLIEIRNRRPLRLDNVMVRPGPEGKRLPGSLEIHQNGLRYQSPVSGDSKIDLLYSNIRHLFFQPCDHELIVVIHVHLKNPIMVGKKKTSDVQLFREASDMAFDETGNRKRRYRYGDEDELEQEQEERRRRAALNKEFKTFSENIAESSNGQLDLDIPFRELGFEGVPFRSNVLCQPTTDCLVQLIDPPFLVVTLQDIELAHLERVSFGLRQFDLVFIYKDFSKPVTHINSIPMEQLDNVKDWLNEVDIPYYEGPVNLNWPTIMKTVTANAHEFFEEGGWSFLSTEGENGGADGSDSESEAESEFAPSDENPSDEDQIEEEYSDEEEESEEFDEDESEEEQGDDWDELDSKAEKEDRKRKT